MAKNKPLLYLGIISLMREKARGVCSGNKPMCDLVELGELFKTHDLRITDRIIIGRLLREYADELSSTGDDRNVKLYFNILANDVENPPDPTPDRLGRTA